MSDSLSDLDEPACLSSRDKLDLSRDLHSSFNSSASGLSLDEITCNEIDDILPKTDYTYSKTASYSSRYLGRRRYSSPNMSRRRVRAPQPAFLSDDEDDLGSDGFRGETSMSQGLYTEDDITSSEQGSEAGGERRRSRSGNYVYTSTPYQQHHISTHDHYYDGMLLRSGHKVEGVKWHVDKDGLVYRYNDLGTALLPTPIGHSSKMDLTRMRGSMTTHETTTTTFATLTSSIKKQFTQRSRRSMKLGSTVSALDMSERKRQLDESQNEKQEKEEEGQHVIKHLYGLDFDGEVSDVDDFDAGRSVRESRKDKSSAGVNETRSSFRLFTYITTTITTIVTTIVTSVTEGSLVSGFKSAAVLASKPIVTPAGWMLKKVASFFSWLVTQAASLLLLEVLMKQRRGRSVVCCCWLIPLLLLLPFIVLAAYYWHPLASGVSHLSEASTVAGGSLGTVLYSSVRGGLSAVGGGLASVGGAFTSGWAYAWLWLSAARSSGDSTSAKKATAPAMDTSAARVEATPGVDLADLHAFIQQTVEQTWQNKGDHFQQQIQQIQIPAGMTREEVETIVAAALAAKMGGLKEGMDEIAAGVKNQMDAHSSDLEAKIARLEAEIKETVTEQQMLVGSLDQARLSLEGISAEDKANWAAKTALLEAKLADLSASVDQLSSQNAALTAAVGNCCRNDTVLADTIRAHVLAIVAEMGEDSSSPLASAVALMGSEYVDKSHLDTRLETVSANIQERVMALLAAWLDEERMERQKQSEVEREEVGESFTAQPVQIGSVDEAVVKSIVEDALIQFSADRVGLPDFALESAGGSVLSVRCSETFYRKTALVSIFGVPLWYISNSPRTVIQPNVNPGECWAFKGSSGYVVVQLSQPVQVTGITLEHIPRSLAPRGDISSAPRNFAIFGLTSESDTEGMNLGNFTYADNDKPIQHFDVQNRHPGIFQLVELRVQSNHGNPEYTCIYRFRVHGLP